MEKTIRINLLFDFYHLLLTEKQQKYLQLYYFDDFSLGEIAESEGVSRQAVYDNIRRSENMLEEYERKLSLYEKYQLRHQLYKKLKRAAETTAAPALLSVIKELEQSEE